MPKRTKKPPIKPELRRQWLRRNEMDGESPPQIAAKDGFDVRTVRKQIETAKEERESREARSMVLRNALESHYQDLCKYAEGLNSTISGADRRSLTGIDPQMEAALRQHLPRSLIWKGLTKWAQLNERLEELEGNTRTRLRDEVEHYPRLGEVRAAGESQAMSAIVDVLAFQVKTLAQGRQGLNIEQDFKTLPSGSGLVNVRYGFSQMAEVKEEHVALIKEVLTDFESRINNWEQFINTRKSFSELDRVKRYLQEELAIIIHRRVVQGKCKYCPI